MHNYEVFNRKTNSGINPPFIADPLFRLRATLVQCCVCHFEVVVGNWVEIFHLKRTAHDGSSLVCNISQSFKAKSSKLKFISCPMFIRRCCPTWLCSHYFSTSSGDLTDPGWPKILPPSEYTASISRLFIMLFFIYCKAVNRSI